MPTPLLTFAAVVAGLAACLATACAGLRVAGRRQASHLRREHDEEARNAILPDAMRRW